MTRARAAIALRTVRLVVLVVAVGGGRPCAQQPAESDSGEPDHLKPFTPYELFHDELADYRRTLGKLLQVDAHSLSMLEKPSFSAESIVSVRAVEAAEGAEPTARRFAVTCSVTNTNVWYAMHGDWTDEATAPKVFLERRKAEDEASEKSGRTQVVAIHHAPRAPSLLEHVRVTTTTAELPAPVAARLQFLWRRMLLQTRYPEPVGAGVDGTTFVFCVDNMFGTTWSPTERRSPLLFVELGHALTAYVNAQEAERAAALRTIGERADALETYFERVPVRRAQGTDQAAVIGLVGASRRRLFFAELVTTASTRHCPSGPTIDRARRLPEGLP